MKDIHETPTLSAGAYSSLDAVGGKLEFEDARTSRGKEGSIVQAHISDKGKQNAHLYLVLFNRDFTATPDNDPFAVSDADLLNVIAVLEFTAANYVDFAANSFCAMGFLGIDVNLPFVLVALGTSLFGQLFVEASTPTYPSTTDLSVGLVIK